MSGSHCDASCRHWTALHISLLFEQICLKEAWLWGNMKGNLVEEAAAELYLNTYKDRDTGVGPGCHVIVVRYLIGSRTCGLIKTATRRRPSRRPAARWPLFELRGGMGDPRRKSLNRSERGFPKWTSLSRSEGGGPKCPCGGDPIWPIPQRNYVIAWGPPCEQTDRHDWKHHLSANYVCGR